MLFERELALVRERVKPSRDTNAMTSRRHNWWLFGSPASGMRNAIASLPRYIAGNAQGKRFLFTWQDATVCPSNLTNVFAFEGDYAMGVLTSSAHQAWAHAESSTLEDRPRYTPTSCFETFPWPDVSAEVREEVGGIAARLIDRRQKICVDRSIGLTDLYNQVDDGAWRDLADLHRELDRAVARAYGWPASVASDPLELRARLAALHAEIKGGKPYRPFVDLVLRRLEQVFDELPKGATIELHRRRGRPVEGTWQGLATQEAVVDTGAGEIRTPQEDVTRILIPVSTAPPE